MNSTLKLSLCLALLAASCDRVRARCDRRLNTNENKGDNQNIMFVYNMAEYSADNADSTGTSVFAACKDGMHEGNCATNN